MTENLKIFAKFSELNKAKIGVECCNNKDCLGTDSTTERLPAFDCCARLGSKPTEQRGRGPGQAGGPPPTPTPTGGRGVPARAVVAHAIPARFGGVGAKPAPAPAPARAPARARPLTSY